MQTDFKLKCPRCGGTKFEVPDRMTDSSMLKCGKCNTSSRLDKLRSGAVKDIEAMVTERLKKAFKL